MAVIEFENVRKAYRRGYGRGSLRDAIPQLLGRVAGRDGRDGGELLWALDGVSFEVNEGETLGLIGPNGAGKTTALKLISRVAKPTSGRIAVRGRLSALIELGAGFHPDLTGRENIYLNAAILGLKKREIDEKFDQIVEFAELADFIDMPVKRYSSGMYVRLVSPWPPTWTPTCCSLTRCWPSATICSKTSACSGSTLSVKRARPWSSSRTTRR